MGYETGCSCIDGGLLVDSVGGDSGLGSGFDCDGGDDDDDEQSDL